MKGVALRIEVRDQVLELLLFRIPGNEHSKDDRFSMDNPSHLELDPLSFGKTVANFVEGPIAKAAWTFSIFQVRIQYPGIHVPLTPDHKFASILVHPVHVIQIHIPPIGKQQAIVQRVWGSGR
jgi:hypothetical protein